MKRFLKNMIHNTENNENSKTIDNRYQMKNNSLPDEKNVDDSLESFIANENRAKQECFEEDLKKKSAHNRSLDNKEEEKKVTIKSTSRPKLPLVKDDMNLTILSDSLSLLYDEIENLNKDVDKLMINLPRNDYNPNNNTIPEEVKNFLYDALGTEHCNVTSFSNLNRSTNEKSLSNHNSKTAYYNDQELQKIHEEDDQQSGSGAVNVKKFQKLKGLSQRIKKKIRKGLSHRSNNDDDEIIVNEENDKTTILNCSILKERIENLRAEIDVQQTLTIQAGKALAFCCSKPEFSTSIERAEAERALLLAKLRNEILLDEIVRLSTSLIVDDLYENFTSVKSQLEIWNIRLKLRDDVLNQDNQSIEWFLLVITEGRRVWATRVISSTNSNPKLEFDDRFVIPELRPNFKLHIRIFSLKLGQQLNYDYEDRLNNSSLIDCTSVISLLPTTSSSSRVRKISDTTSNNNKTKQHEDVKAATKNSSFINCGSMKIDLCYIRTTELPWSLTTVPLGSNLSKSIDLKFNCKLKWDVRMESFVNLGEELNDGRLYWTRLYCVLMNQCIEFFKYPCDREKKLTERVFDLGRCSTKRIELADRSVCPKPRTLIVHMYDVNNEITNNSKIVRKFLSFDEKWEVEEWQYKLNYVVTALREWLSINKF